MVKCGILKQEKTHFYSMAFRFASEHSTDILKHVMTLMGFLDSTDRNYNF